MKRKSLPTKRNLQRVGERFFKRDLTPLKNNTYYWMSPSGKTYLVNFGSHWETATLLLAEFEVSSETLDVVAFFISRSWRRIGIGSWKLDYYPSSLTREQRKIIEEWVAVSDRRSCGS
jgi:hypothetical protein